MIQFLLQIFNKINKLDTYTSQYKKLSNNIEIPILAYTNWGLHFAQIKDFNSAIEKLETAMLMSNQNPKPCISLGVIYAKLKEYEKAEQVLKKALARDSQNPYTYSLLSSVFIATDKFNQAEDALKKAIKLAPSDAENYLNYGIFYAKQQKRHKAIEMLKKSKYLNPSNLHTYFLLGVMYFELNQINEAFYEFKELEKLKANYKNLNYYLALCYKKEKNYIAVTEYAQRALEDSPLNSSVYILLAQSYISNNKQDEGLKIFEQAFNKGLNDFDLFFAWGNSFLQLNKISEAEDKFKTALNLKPNDSNTLYEIGVCYLKNKNYEKAEEYYNRAINSDSNNYSALADLGLLYYKKNDFEKALKNFFNSISLSSEKSYLYFYIANCYYRMGKTKKSLDFYEKTIEYYPTHLEAYINYALNLLFENNTKDALRKIRSAFQINRTSEKVLLVYSFIELKSGLYANAIEKTDLILSKAPENNGAKYIKIQALINLKKPQEAITLIHSLSENEKDSMLFIYLNFQAYKKLVEDNPSNYNEGMLKIYADKLNEINSDYSLDNDVVEYIHKSLNINKG